MQCSFPFAWEYRRNPGRINLRRPDAWMERQKMRTLSRCSLFAMAVSCLAFASQAPAAVEGWVLGMGWSPEYCDDHPGSKETQCAEAHYFLINGLRPDFRGGEAGDCKQGEGVTAERLNTLLHLIPNKVSLRRLWREHGACSGLAIDEYFVQVDRASRLVALPAAYLNGEHPVRVSASEFRQQIVQLNPGLDENGIRLSCKGSWLREVQVCLDPKFGFRACGANVEETCKSELRVREIPANRKARSRKS